MGGTGGSITNTQERPLLYTPVAEQIRSLREDSVLEKGWKQVAKIYSAQKATLRVVEEYDQTTSNYGPGTYDRDKYDMVAVCGGIVKDLVDDVIEKLYFPPALEAIERAQRLNKRDKSDLLKSADKAVYEFAAMGVSESLMEEIVSDAITDTFQEALEARIQIHDLLSKTIIKAVQDSCQTFSGDEPVVALTLKEMQAQAHKGSKGEVGHKAVIKVQTPDLDLRTFALEEKRYFERNVLFQKVAKAFPIDPDGYEGNVSALRVSCCGKFIAVGTSKGYIDVWDSVHHQLVRRHRPNHGIPIIQMAWSLDSLYLTALIQNVEDEDDTQVCIYNLQYSNPTAPMSDSSGDFVVPEMDLMTIIGGNDLRRPGRGGDLPNLEEDMDAKKALSIETVAWHPSFSMFGSPEGIVLGLERGVLVKCNIQGLPEPLAIFTEQSKPLAQTGSAAIEREFFQGHTEKVVFVETRLVIQKGDIGGDQSTIPEYVSVDTQGVILTWRYLASNFTGFGSFRPHARCRLDLTEAIGEEEGVVEEAAMSRTDLVMCLIRRKEKQPSYGQPGATVIVIDIAEGRSQLKRKISLPALGHGASCSLAVGSELGQSGLFYGYLATNKDITVYSLTSGEAVKRITDVPWPAVSFAEVCLSVDPWGRSFSVAIQAGFEAYQYKFVDGGTDGERNKLKNLVE